MIGSAMQQPEKPVQSWLNLEEIAALEFNSELKDHPIEAAFQSDSGVYWQAAESGKQTIRLVFDKPQQLNTMRLSFRQGDEARTQEFVLRWSSDDGATYKEIARQQYCFSAPDALIELEHYHCELHGVSSLELVIVPNISGGNARATLDEWLIA